MKVFGFSGTSAAEKPTNDEIMGEWLLYTTPQTDDVRKGIEAYLMWKWLGKLRDGFSDFRGMTVTGAGTLAAEGAEYLPPLTTAFTGTVELTRASQSFTLPQRGGDAAVDAVNLPNHTVALPATVTINLDATGASPGDYRLMTVGSFASETSFVTGTVTGHDPRRVVLRSSSTGLYVRVVPKGISVSFR